MKRLYLFTLFVLTGCTVGPDYERPAIDLPAQYPIKTVEGDAAVAAEWWTLYRDPTLEDLVAATRANNADIRIAAAQVEEAEALLRQARAALFPEITGGLQRSRTRVSALTAPPPIGGFPLVRPDTRLFASTNFELDFWGRLGRAGEAARAGLLGSRYAKEVVTLTLGSLTAQTYFGLRSLDAQLAVLEQTIRTRRESVELARARLDAGLASELDLYQAQAALSDALVQRRDTERSRALLEHELGQLTGRPDLKLAAGDLFTLPVPPTPPVGLPSTLLERRPDIRAAEQTMIAANAQIGIARAAMFPAISLTGLVGAQSAAFSDLLASGSSIWSLGFALALPIFDAGRREALVEQTEARRRQALASYQRSIESAFREVSDALVNLEQTGASEADLREQLQAARNVLQLSSERYEAGYSPYLEVLDAQRTANEAELAFVRNRQARLAFSVDLMKALGGGWRAE
ncbi:MAG TPA: efflux transporter outer membrane subunit [Burkholderiales bacterium]|nr:efflux transporter outer membrane subunit [Burkholderiales bacterium]